MSQAKEVIDLAVSYGEQVIVDNDFEAAYNIPFKAFKEYTKEDIIEALFIELAILYENVPEVKDYFKQRAKENSHS